MEPTISVAASVEQVAFQAAERLARAAEDAVVATGRFAIALSGGHTPEPLYQLLATDFADKLPWEKMHILFADERCVPADHPDSNFGMVCKALLDHVPVPYANIHRMAGEKDPQVAADEYNQLLEQQYPKGPDLALLGLGPDGHTASLFPRTAALEEKSRACVANFVPQFDRWRLTMTTPYLNRAFEVMVLVTGKDKAPAARQALEEMANPLDCPIRLIAPASGRMTWLMDVASAGMDEDDAQADG